MKKIIYKILKRLLPDKILISRIKMLDKKQYRGGGIEYIVLSVGHACTLKCKNCGNFCYCAKPEMKRYRLEDLINDVTNVLSCVNFINELQIQGGEPFIYSDLKGLIQFLSSQKKIKHITIATNGTIIPKDELFNLIKKYDIALRISNYPITKEKGLILYNECQKRGIDASIYNFGNNKSEWSYLGGIETPRENDDKIVSKRFWYCSFKGCLTIDDGEINWCSRIRNAYILQGFERPKNDHVDVRNSKKLKERFWYFINHKNFAEACRYCYGTYDSDKIPPAEQLGHENN